MHTGWPEGWPALGSYSLAYRLAARRVNNRCAPQPGPGHGLLPSSSRVPLLILPRLDSCRPYTTRLHAAALCSARTRPGRARSRPSCRPTEEERASCGDSRQVRWRRVVARSSQGRAAGSSLAPQAGPGKRGGVRSGVSGAGAPARLLQSVRAAPPLQQVRESRLRQRQPLSCTVPVVRR